MKLSLILRKSCLGLCLFSSGLLAAYWYKLNQPAKPQPSPIPPVSQPSKPVVKRQIDLTAGNVAVAAKDWAATDPAGLQCWLCERDTPLAKGELWHLFEGWLQQDPDAAFAAAMNLPGDFDREELLPRMLGKMLESPAGLDTVLKWLPRLEAQVTGFTHPSDKWLKGANLAEMATKLEAYPGGSSYFGAMVRILAKTWLKQDFNAAFAWSQGLPPGLRGSAMGSALETWTERSPAQVLEFLATKGTSEDRWSAHAPLRKLAETDPKAALEWWEANRGIPDPNCVRQIFEKWQTKSPEEAAQFARSIEDPTLRMHCLDSWAQATTLKTGLEQLAYLKDPKDHATVLKNLASNASYGNDADRALFSPLLEEPEKWGITPAVARTYTSGMNFKNKAQLEWATTLPESIRTGALEGILTGWKDPVLAAKCISELPEGPSKQQATLIYKKATN
jgi:hypothetical protein